MIDECRKCGRLHNLIEPCELTARREPLELTARRESLEKGSFTTKERLFELEKENQQLADQYATKGTVKHFALRLGFLPHDETEAELIILRTLMDEGFL